VCVCADSRCTCAERKRNTFTCLQSLNLVMIPFFAQVYGSIRGPESVLQSTFLAFSSDTQLREGTPSAGTKGLPIGINGAGGWVRQVSSEFWSPLFVLFYFCLFYF
jgi:hypothetical protein